MFKNLREKINEGIVLIVYEHAKMKKKKKSLCSDLEKVG